MKSKVPVFRAQMTACGVVVYQLDFGTAAAAMQRARDLGHPLLAKPVESTGDLARFEINDVICRAYEIRLGEEESTDQPSYQAILEDLETEVARISGLREETGLGSIHLTPIPRSRAPVIETGRYAVFHDRVGGSIDTDICSIDSVSDTGKTATMSGSAWRDRVNVGDIVQTFKHREDAQAAIDHRKATAQILSYVECARAASLAELIDNTD